VAGNYRPIELFDTPTFVHVGADGSDIRMSLGTLGGITGHFFVPGGGTGGVDLDVRLTGVWTESNGQVIISFDPESVAAGLPSTLVLNVGFLEDRIGLMGSADVNGVALTLDLAKPRPPDAADGGDGGGRIPSF